MITCELLGGIGNQLFQIFNLISYALTYNTDFYFENKNPLGKRPYYWDTLFKNLKQYITPIKRKIHKYKEKDFYYTKIPDNIHNNNVKFIGYYQSYKYFKHNQSKIIKLIDLDHQQKVVKDKYLNIYNLNNLISLHFRIGDFKKIKEYHPIQDIQYYISALNKIKKQVNLSKVDILCFFEEKDINLVNKNIQLLENNFKDSNFIKINTKISDYEQFLLMSLCKHNIIANSTFSWWAAYLNKYPNKIVIYPSIWFGIKNSSLNTQDLFPSNWIKV
tara:strand:+ start:1072 stop:1893 length:822 start_codon:yes stop_codon:yes gene_type:complete